jgi:hypothetical protein
VGADLVRLRGGSGGERRGVGPGRVRPTERAIVSGEGRGLPRRADNQKLYGAGPLGRARCIGGMSGAGQGCTTVQANPTRERTLGVKGIPVSV